MGFFTDNAGKLAPLALDGDAEYRECQVGAAWATLAHFTASSEPALISMPTGSGKTALMMMLSFLLEAERVIVVTPSVVLRGQTAEKFKDLKDIKAINAYAQDGATPSVHDHTGQITSPGAWSAFLDFDVSVITPHTTSAGYEDVVGPPPNLFGPETLLFFDEAHHSRARTWQVLMDTFAASRMVLLTATPFRNDNRRLLAKLVYHYPMKNAMDAGIYAAITYHAVDPDDVKAKDQELCKKAKSVYQRQQRAHPNARLLIRAEGVTESGRLLALYRKAGLDVEEVNYRQTFESNSEVLQGIRSGSLDGVVCIDQIGEGLDIPNLKIAVLHKPRQSFPATVQFIGRICREATAQIGAPHLIACPDDVRGPMQRLYTQDNSWRDLVPQLVDRIVGRVARRSAFHGVVDVETELDLAIEDIEPFFSVRIYRSSSDGPLTFDTQLDLREDVVPIFRHEMPNKNMLVLITAIERTLPWAEKADLATPCFDLHVFYWHEASKLLFEHTTSDNIAGMIRKSFWGASAVRIDAASVAKALRVGLSSQYLMFGLSNLARGSRSVPSYKTYMGTEVEGAVHPTDSRSFTPGHALAKYATGETRGIGSNQARVWSIKRAALDQFRDWCDKVATCLKKRGDSRLPNVEFLPAPQSISKFPGKPLAMYVWWDPRIMVAFQIDGARAEVGSISFERPRVSGDKKAISGIMRIGEGPCTEETAFTYSLATPTWHFERGDLPSLRVDDGQEYHLRSVAEFLDYFPPIVVLDDGSTVSGGSRFEPKLQLSSLPSECLDYERDWSRCDIHVEFEYTDDKDPDKNRIPNAGKKTVHDQLEEWLKTSSLKGTLIIKDHATGEIADFIEVQPSDWLVRLYHCKACSPGKSAGARIDELKVLEQVLRSINHIGSNTLMSELHRRVNGTERPKSKMVKGSTDSLKKVAQAFHANEWKYEVVVVNPGINCRKSIRSGNTNTLLIACYEWLATANARLEVIGQ